MPVFGKEEPAAFARQSSNNNAGAGVPIKKRRFPVLRPPSPPPQEPTSPPAKNDSADNKHLSTSHGASIMDATVAANSVGKFEAVKNPLLEVKKEVVVDPNSNLGSTGSEVNVSFAKPKEPNLATESDVIVKSQLNLAPKETIASVGKSVISREVPLKCKPEPFPSTAECALGPTEPIVQASMGQKCDQIPANLYPSLSLSLSKEKSVEQSKNVESTVNNDSVVSANRSNWDLNTTMDAWEGFVGGDAPPLDTVGFNGLNKVGGSLDTSPSLVSQSELGVNVDLGKQSLGAGDCRPNFPVPSLPSTQYRSEDLLNLSLSPSFARTNFSVKPSGSSTNMPFGSSASMPFASLANLASRSLANIASASSAIIGSGSSANIASGSSANIPFGCMPFASLANITSGSSANIASGSSANLPPGLSANVPSGLSANMNTGSSARVNLSMPVDYSKLLGPLVSTKNITAGIIVKPELFDGNAKHDSVAAKGNSMGGKQDSVATTVNSVGGRQDSVAATVNPVGSSTIVKKESVERCSKNDFAVPNPISRNVVGDRPIKSEPTQDINKGTLILTDSIMNRSAGTVLQFQDNVSLMTRPNLMLENSCSSGLSLSSDVSNQEHSAEKAVQDNIVNTRRDEDSNVGEIQNSRGNVEAFGSDDEKINISTDMMEEDSYGSDSESEGHATKGTRSGKEEEEYEDGEIRESLVQNATLNVLTTEREENANCGDCENSNLSSLGLIHSVNLNQDPAEAKNRGDVLSEDHIKECVVSGVEERSDQILDKGVTFQEPLTVEVGPASVEAETFLNATHGTEDLSDKGTNGCGKGTGTETETAVGEVPNENADTNENDEREKDDLCLPATDSSLNEQQDAAKDTDSGGGGGRSRIITLPRASDVASPTKTRSIPEHLFVWGTGKERYSDFEGDKLHLRRNRDELFTDSPPRRYVRDRFQDQSFRGSRMKFVRGRGRAYNNRFDRSEWVSSDRKFNTENYSGEYRFPRNKHASAGDEELESDFAQDGDLVGSGRGGRKPLGGDDFPPFRNPGSRRLSPPRGGRGGGPTTRGIHMVRRIARNISPNGEEGSNLVGNRHGDKFTSNEGLEDQFPRGNRKFSLVQRRGLPHVRSKSPMRTRTRSPGPWSSPRRRSPDGYNGIQELTRQRRSPPIYRMERVRSPPLNFPDEVVSRRRGSPPYITRPSNDFQRPILSNRRSPAGRPIPRNNRRFDNSLDPQERTNSGEYFEGPIRANRYHDEEGSGDDRRKLSERRGGRGPFRPSFSGSGSGAENFRFHQEGGPRPFRFGPEGDSEFVERSSGNLREREFDRRIKNRPVIANRRMRGVEEQEGDFRQGGPVWHDDNFGDASRGKRRRF